MKKRLLLFTFLLSTVYSYSQEKTVRQKVVSEYDRNSLTVFVAKVSNDYYTQSLAGYADNIKFDDKFYDNSLSTKVFNANYKREEQTSSYSSSSTSGTTYSYVLSDFKFVDVNDKSKTILEQLNNQKTGRQIIETWFRRQPDGTMSIKLFQERGLYNATDADYLEAVATKRGINQLKDYGTNLIEKSFVLVIDFVDTKRDVDKNTGNVSFSSTVKGYLYKIRWTEEDLFTLYEKYWIDKSTPAYEKEKRITAFNNINYPLEFTARVSPSVFVTESKYDKKTDQQLLMELAQEGYNEVLYRLARKVEDFRVKAPIKDVKPVIAKIGKKEGLKVDHRYFAFEYVYNEKTKIAEPKRRGIVRATSKIADNRYVARGEMGTSQFYQVSGRKMEPGYLLQQRNDFGIGLYGGYETGSIIGPYFRLDWRLNRLIEVPVSGIFIYGCFAMQPETEFEDFVDIEGNEESKSFTFYRFDFGLGKSVSFLRNFEIMPYAGFGLESAAEQNPNNPPADTVSAVYIKGGANLAINLYGDWIQLFGGVGYYIWLDGTYKTVEETELSALDRTYGGKNNGIFKGRGLSGIVGIRFQF